METPSLFVAGHGVTPPTDRNRGGSVYITIKDKVARTALFASLAKAERTGSIFLAKGVTLDEAKTQFPVGRDLSKLLRWGAPRVAATANGEALVGVYNVEEIEVAQPVEDAPVDNAPAQQ